MMAFLPEKYAFDVTVDMTDTTEPPSYSTLYWQEAGSGARQENERGQPTTPSQPKTEPKEMKKPKFKDLKQKRMNENQNHSHLNHRIGKEKAQV